MRLRNPLVSSPPPQQVTFTIGDSTPTINAKTNDPLHHFGAFYQFDLAFEEA